MQIHKIKIPKSQLLKLPKSERVFLVQLGHICNELNFFNKLVLFTNDTSLDGPERKAMTAQSLAVIRVFIGKVFEAWRMLERDFFGAKLSRDLEPLLSPDGKEALDFLKKYFGGNSLLAATRNSYSFHYHSDDIENAVASFADDKVFEMYLAENYANTLHFFSEEIISVGMLAITNESEPQKAMDRLVGDLVEVGGRFIDFTGHALAAIFEKSLGVSWDDFDTELLEVPSGGDLERFKVPFFLERGEAGP